MCMRLCVCFVCVCGCAFVSGRTHVVVFLLDVVFVRVCDCWFASLRVCACVRPSCI